MAQMANLEFDLTPMHDSMNFKWSGFNDSMPNFISETISRLTSLPQQDLREIFDHVKEKLLFEFKNAYLKQSYQQAFMQMDNIFFKTSFEQRKQRVILQDYTYEEFQGQLTTWLKNARYVWYVTGNLAKDKTIELIDKARSEFNTKNIPIGELPKVQPVSLAPGAVHLVESPLDDKTNENSCMLTYFEAGVHTHQTNHKFKLTNAVMMNYLYQPFFNDLRTKQ